MQYLQGSDREQMFMMSLEEAVAQDAFVRIVDVFVDAIDFKGRILSAVLSNFLFLLLQNTTG